MKTTAFSISIYKYKVENWNIKKEKLLDLFNNFQHKTVANVITSPIDIRTNILLEEIKKFEQEIKINFNLLNFWFQKYENGMDHAPHNHGQIGFSSVCFVEYNKNFHKPTTFIFPFISCFNGDVERYEPDVNEGDIIFFPSNLLHYAPINTSDKERIISSFNLKPNLNDKIQLTYK